MKSITGFLRRSRISAQHRQWFVIFGFIHPLVAHTLLRVPRVLRIYVFPVETRLRNEARGTKMAAPTTASGAVKYRQKCRLSSQ